MLLSATFLFSCAQQQNSLELQDLSQGQSVSASATKKMSKDQFVNELASKLHDNWRAGRKKTDGTYEPRPKETKDAKWIKAHNNITQVDIANTNYSDLPEDWKKENRDSALVASNIVYKAGSNKTKMDSKFIEESSASIHSEWLKRNTYAKGGPLDVAYSKLPEVEKEKDRIIIKLAIALYTVMTVEI